MNMDYCLETIINNLEFDKEFFSTLLERMEFESDFINSSIDANHIVLEANNNQGIWEKIKAFFKSIFGTFTTKTKLLFDSNKKWMDENFNKLDKLDYSKLKIDMIPFWLRSIDGVKSDVTNINGIADNVLNNPKKLNSYKYMDDVKKKLFKDYLNEDGDLTIGFKNKFRVGAAKGPIKTVELTGDALKKEVTEFKDYCFNYGKDIVPMVQSWINKAEQSLTRIEKVLKESINMNFCLIENSMYSNTDIAYCSNFDVVFEAEVNQNDKTSDKKSADASVKPTQVTVVNTDNKEETDKHDETKKYSGLNTSQLTMYKNVAQIIQLAITSAMTVLEERFHAYINALKGIVGKGGEGKDNTPEEKK